ncbi:unnamed protein product, partial [Urochloa humidicola]
ISKAGLFPKRIAGSRRPLNRVPLDPVTSHYWPFDRAWCGPLAHYPRTRELANPRERARAKNLIPSGLRPPPASALPSPAKSFRLPRHSPPSTRSAHLPLHLHLRPPPSVLCLPRRPLLPLLASSSPFACHAGHRLHLPRSFSRHLLSRLADQQVARPVGFPTPEQLLRHAVGRYAPDAHQVLHFTVLMPACQLGGALLCTKR